MNKKSRVKWYYRVEKGDCADWYCEYQFSVYQPSFGWYPVNDKYRKDKWRFKRSPK